MNNNLEATAVGPLFIALIKYWGNKDDNLRIPYNDNLAINLDLVGTKTRVVFSQEFKKDILFIDGQRQTNQQLNRVVKVIDLLRKKARVSWHIKIESQNLIPTASGLGSSASGFSALVKACNKALNLNLNNKDLSLVARIGSGSAARSICDGFTVLRSGNDHKQAYAESLFPPNYWQLSIFLVVISYKQKKVLTTQGHHKATTSPLYAERQWGVKDRLQQTIKAIKQKDIWRLGHLVEADALSLHGVTMSQKPAIYYWSQKTFKLISKIVDLRQQYNRPIFWTIDAGQNLFILTNKENESLVSQFLKNQAYVKKFYLAHPGYGARIIDNDE